MCDCKKSKSDPAPHKIFYFEVEGSIDEREAIAEGLEPYGFQWIDMTGGQAAYEDNGKFELFKKVVDLQAFVKGIVVRHIKHITDPGIGLMITEEELNKY